MKHPSKTSKLAPIIQELALLNGEWDDDPNFQMSGVRQSPCGFPSKMEDLFASLTAHHFATHLGQATQTPFHHLIYRPNTIIENQCGFDYSIGHYNTKKRLRFAHKYIDKWCDTSWSYSTNEMRDHLKLLRTAYLGTNRRCKPYLVLHVCYCLHEYRRMGIKHKGTEIPDIESAKRVLFVDLCPFLETYAEQELHDSRLAIVTVKHESRKNSLTASFKDSNSTRHLSVFDIKAMISHAKEFLLK